MAIFPMDSGHSFERVSPIERVYLEVREAAAAKPKPPAPQTTALLNLDASDVDAILHNWRGPTPAELEHILSRAKFFRLNSRDKNEISVGLTVALASRGRPEPNPNAELFTTLDLMDTPVGILHHRSWFDRELREGAQRVASCTRHTPPPCQCWREARECLWYIQDVYRAKSPEAFMATRIFEMFEEMENSDRSGERQRSERRQECYLTISRRPAYRLPP